MLAAPVCAATAPLGVARASAPYVRDRRRRRGRSGTGAGLGTGAGRYWRAGRCWRGLDTGRAGTGAGNSGADRWVRARGRRQCHRS